MIAPITPDECSDAMRNGRQVVCWHKSHLHLGWTTSLVKIIGMRNKRDVLVKFDDGFRDWVDISKLEMMKAGA